MAQERKGKGPRTAHSFQPPANGASDDLEIFGAAVGQLLPFDVSPNGLQRIQFRRIPGQSFHPEPFSLPAQVFGHDTALVRRQAIPNQNGFLAAQVSFEILEERDQAFRVVAAGASLKVQPATPSVPAEAQGGTDRKRFPIEGMDQDRSLSAGRPGPPHRGPLGDAAFVLEENPGFSAPSVFFTAGHFSETQYRIASGLRSLACRAGRWRVQSIAPRIFQT